MPRLLSRNVKLLGWASLLNDIGSEMTFPLMPLFLTKVLGGTAQSLGVIEGLADSTASLLKLFSGGWSDRVGTRKGFVVLGYALTALVRPLAALAWAPWQLMATRTTDRIGKGVRTTARDAMVVESTDRQNLGWAFGFARSMDHLGAAIGPLIATLLLSVMGDSAIALRWLFALTIIPGLAVVALLWFGLEETKHTTRTVRSFTLSLKPFDGNFKLYLLAIFIFTLGNSSDAFLLKRAGDLGISDFALPLLWLALHVVKSAGSLAAGAMVNTLGPRRMIFAGWSIYAAIYLLFAYATNATHAWTLFLIYGVYYALTEPVEKKLVADLGGIENKGLAYGWFNFAVGMGALPANLLFGWMYEQFGALTAFGFGAVMAAVATVLLALVRIQPASSGTTTDEHG